MRVNEYNNLEQFYEEYNYDRDIFKGHYIGLEFFFRGNYYRLAHDYSNLDNQHEFKYFAYQIIQNKNNAYFDGEYVLLGEFRNLDEMLDDWIIDGICFKELIIMDETKILGKD